MVLWGIILLWILAVSGFKMGIKTYTLFDHLHSAGGSAFVFEWEFPGSTPDTSDLGIS